MAPVTHTLRDRGDLSAGKLNKNFEDISDLIDVLRLPRPRYYASSSGGTVVTVPASSSSPIDFLVGSTIYTVSSDMSVDLGKSGVGGLSGGTVAANTPYYIYAVVSNSNVVLIADSSDPNTGPKAYSDWSYVGATTTDSGSAVITAFQAINGRYDATDEIEIENHTGDTNVTAVTFASLPVTAITGIFHLYNDGAVADTSVIAGGVNAAEDAMRTHCSSAGHDNYTKGTVPIFESQKAYVQAGHASTAVGLELMGWIENPRQWK